MNKKFSEMSILLAGQLISSRTETLEDYLKGRLKRLGVIGITSPFAQYNVSRSTLYEKGTKTKEFKLLSFLVGNMKWYRQPLLVLSFILYFITIIYASMMLRRKFDIFIGVAGFSTFVGVFLKKFRVCERLIYYSIDYYPKPRNLGFNRFGAWLFRIMDKSCVKSADLVWHICPRISEARYKFAGIRPQTYKYLVVPLTYASRFQRVRPIEEIERYTIGFVGTLSQNQGIQLLIQAIPAIIKEVPQLKVRIIGKGPYENALKSLIVKSNLEKYFIFHGFIKDDDEVLEILSRCALGIAPWTSQESNNVIYADPGKPKLYAFCGIPTVITNGAGVAKEISDRKAGISIKYDERELCAAIIRLLKDQDALKIYKNNAYEFAKEYTTEKVFGATLEDTLNYLN